jgi:hypothetical protein
VKIERRKSAGSGSSKSPRKTRPPSTHENNGFPKSSIPGSSRRDDPSNFGIPTPASAIPLVSQPIPRRPRATTAQTYSYPSRPLSYHAVMPAGDFSRPPLSASAYYQQPVITPPYPPPSPPYMEHLRYTPTPQTEYVQPQARPLSSRFESIARTPSAFEPTRTQSAFDPIPRTPSAFGARSGYEGASSYSDDAYASASESATIRRDRRDSIRAQSTGMTKAQADYAAMPPPTSRPSILRRSTEYRAPTEYVVDPGPYRDGRTQYRDGSRPRRPSVNRHSVSYDLGSGSEGIRVEAANSGRRRQTWYEQPVSTPAGGYEDKMHRATSYQADVEGPTVPLTAETLKRQQRRQAGSSRSTKSSQSRDESDYKKSATTRTTRSMSNDNDENVTIKVMGQARVVVGGAQIDCNEGGEIEIKRQKSLRNGSEPSNSEYGGGRIEDRRSRVDRRSSRSSQSGHSYTRSTPHYPMDNFI